MVRLTVFLFCFLVMACSGALQPQQVKTDKPMRIVSLDYCADQYVLKLADRAQILAISPDGVKEFSYMRDAAIGLPTVRPIAENVLVLKPDLIVRAYGGGAKAADFFERAGIPVLQVGWASALEGEGLASLTHQIAHMADGLGQAERGAALIAEFQQRLGAIKARHPPATALYMTSAGVTSGPGSLVHEMLVAAGLENYQDTPGWHSIPLERLAYEQPDIVAAAFFDTKSEPPNGWSAANHPVARAQFESSNTVVVQGASTACGGWFILDAIEALANGAQQ